MKKKQNIIHNTQSGFTLLFAVLVSSLIISISATIISIAVRQTILSGTSRESQYAFYAANAALECAHYWDTKNLQAESMVVFPAPDTSDDPLDASLKDTITCSEFNIANPGGYPGYTGWKQTSPNPGTENQTIFELRVTDKSGGDIDGIPPYTYCSEVTVTKTDDNGVIITRIEAKGYNTCDVNNPRRVERSLVQQYEA